MSFLDSIFGRPRQEPPVVVESMETKTEKGKIRLQEGIDKTNTQITMWQRKADAAHSAAKKYKANGQKELATQKIAEEKQYRDLVRTANATVLHRGQKMSIMVKQGLLGETHADLTSADSALKDMSNTLNLSSLQDTLFESDNVGREVDDLANELINNTPFGNMDALNDELDNLSISDDETDINYDFPAVARTNTTPVVTTPNRTTSEITKSNIMASLW